ncbi:MAG: type I restriction enzyme HsdR N-terminal domain-containing protein, partial [Sphingobacteriaceae bacterium]
LINQKQYPKTLMRLEGGLIFNGMAKRSDIVVFNSSGQKVLMVECKAPSVNINQKAFDQIARYNMTHKIALLAVTNGLKHYYCRIDHEKGEYSFIEELPGYRELTLGL